MGSASNKYFTLCSSPNAWVIIHYFGDTDKFTASKIVESGRSKPKLQIKAVKKSFSCLYMKNINQKNTPHWSGEQCGNWKSVMSTFGNSTFRLIIEKWNAMTVDYFLTFLRNAPDLTKYLHLPIKAEDVFYSVLTKQIKFECLTPLAWNKSGSTEILILPYWSLNRFGPFAIWKSN